MPHVVVVAGRRPLRSFWFLPRAWLCEWSGIREVLPACVGLQCSYAVGGYPVGGEEFVMCVMGSSSATYSGVKATATFLMLSPRIHLDFDRLRPRLGRPIRRRPNHCSYIVATVFFLVW